jgi:DNA-binding FadR family transcriptional regulator
MTQNADVAFHTEIKFVTADPVLIKAGRVATSVLPESHQFVKSVESTIFTELQQIFRKI